MAFPSLLSSLEMQALALSELLAILIPDMGSSGGSFLQGKSKPICSICELCRFHVQYSGSPMWTALCGLLNRALQVRLCGLLNRALQVRLCGR